MIVAKEIGRRYGEKIALSPQSFALKEGTSLCLLGPSGSGKTTLLNAVSLLDDGYEGTLDIDGKDPRRLSKKERERLRLATFGYVFPDARLLSYLTLEANVLLPLRLRHESFEPSRLRLLAERLGIADLLGRMPNAVSEGERQRAAILRALVPGPRCLVADEPTSHLDYENALAAMTLLGQVCREEGCSVLVSTHQESLASCFDEVLRL